jgi:glycosyltransferase involved in cell wall biosynthesis
MKIGFLCSEYFGYREEGGRTRPTSVHGGYGFLTRQKAEALAARGHEVHVFVPAPSLESGDNRTRSYAYGAVTLHQYAVPEALERPSRLGRAVQGARHYVHARRGRIPALDRLLAERPLDIYQSEHPSLYSSNARRHSDHQVLVFQDPWDLDDFRIMARSEREYVSAAGGGSPDGPREEIGFYDRATVATGRRIISELVGSLPPGQVFGEADFICAKARSLYGLAALPEFLPNPIDVPADVPPKSDRPSVVWIARWDVQKRVDIALRVARSLPEIDFTFIGSPTERSDLIRVARSLHRAYADAPNIRLLDFIPEAEKRAVLGRTWTLLNTSVREGLPITFLEAGAYGLSIVSAVDPDGWATRFGQRVEGGDYAVALRRTVAAEEFRTKGRAAREHVRAVHETGRVIDRHVAIYRRILDSGPAAPAGDRR